MSWTPGPWKLGLDKYLDGDTRLIVVPAHDTSATVATVEGEADLRLIAKAPEMAELLGLVAAVMEDVGEMDDGGVVHLGPVDTAKVYGRIAVRVPRIRALLAEIKGES